MTIFLKNLDLSKIKGHAKRTKQVNRSHTVSFPLKLFRMLEATEREGKECIVSWHPDGSSFQVHHAQKFVDEVLPNHFKQTKYKSFQRQLNFYGFQRITSGPLEGSYQHHLFVKGNEELCKQIRRQTQSVSKSIIKSPIQEEEQHASDDDSASECSESNDNDRLEADMNLAVFEKQEDVLSSQHAASFKRRDSFQIAMAMLEGSIPGFLESTSVSGTRDSIHQALDTITSLGEPARRKSSRRASTYENGTRLSFVGGKNFHFLPVEFTDLYGL